MRVEPFASHDRNPCSLSPMRQSQLLPCKGPGTAWRVPVPHTTRLHAERTLRCRCRAAPGSRSSPVPREPQVPAKRAQAAATEQLVFTGTSQESESEDELECVSTGLGDVACEIVHHRHHRPATPAPATAPLNPALQAVLMMSPFAFWGTSMVVMKGLMASVPPMVMGAFRLLPAGAILVIWAALQGRPQPSGWKAWAWVAAFALVDGAAFQGFLAEGLTKTPAGLGSVIIDSQPLTVAVLAAWLFGERLGPAGIAGLVLGVAGLLLLELPEQYFLLARDDLLNVCCWDSVAATSSALTQTDTATTATAITAAASSTAIAAAAAASPAASVAQRVWESLNSDVLLALGSPSAWLASGEFWMLAAAQAMAIGTVMVRYVTKECDPVMATGWHMILGGLLLTALALHDDPQALTHALQGLGPADAAAAAYVSLLGGAASYGIFFYLASSSQGSLTRLSSLTFLTPVFAAVTGYFVLGEVLTVPQLVGGTITLGSVLLITSMKNGAGSSSPAQGTKSVDSVPARSSSVDTQ